MGRFTRILIVVGFVHSICALMLLMCCSPWKPPEPPAPEPVVVPDTPPEPVDDDAAESDFCPAACSRWVALGCGDVTVCIRFQEPGDRCIEVLTCDEWCKRIIVEASPGVAFHPRCVALTEPPATVDDKCSWLDAACAGAAP